MEEMNPLHIDSSWTEMSTGVCGGVSVGEVLFPQVDGLSLISRTNKKQARYGAIPDLGGTDDWIPGAHWPERAI